MFFFRHPKPATDRKEVAVLVQQNRLAPAAHEQVLVAKRVPDSGVCEKKDEAAQPMQKGDAKPPPA